MECIIAYLLLTLFIDLALEIARMDCTADEAEWIKRSLWVQTPFDCGTRAVGAMATVPQQHIEARRNRFRVVRGRGDDRVVKPLAAEGGIMSFPCTVMKTKWLPGNRCSPKPEAAWRTLLPTVTSGPWERKLVSFEEY